MSLKKEINKVCNLFELVERGIHDEDSLSSKKKQAKEVKDLITTDKIRELNKKENIEFPDLEHFLKLYIKLYFCFSISQEFKLYDDLTEYRKDYKEFEEYLRMEGDNDVESITIKVNHRYAMKLKSPIITKQIMMIFKEHLLDHSLVENDLSMLEKGVSLKIPTKGRYNKEFINGLFPLYNHLKEYNPELTNIAIYTYLVNFAGILGFDFEKEIKGCTEEYLIKAYFEKLK